MMSTSVTLVMALPALVLVLLACESSLVTSEKTGTFVVGLITNTPAAIDSVLTFRASLQHVDGTLPVGTFTYVWINNAVNGNHSVFDIDTTVSNSSASLRKTFSAALSIKPGPYHMEVRVYQKDVNSSNILYWQAPPVASSSVEFTLTEYLNVFVSFTQQRDSSSSEHMSQPGTFAVGHPITSTVHITDVFDNAVFYQYQWFVDGTRYTDAENKSEYSLVLGSPGSHRIENVAAVFMNAMSSGVSLQIARRDSQLVTNQLELKNVITDLHIDAKHEIYPYDEFIADISCTGSSPFEIHWNVSADHGRHLVSTQSVVDGGSCRHRVWHMFDKPGNYVMSVSIENYVSQLASDFTFQVVDPVFVSGTEPRVPVYLPVGSVVIAVVAVIAIVWSFLYYRRHSEVHIEQADFEFYQMSPNDVNSNANNNFSANLSLWSRKAKELIASRFHEIIHRLKSALRRRRTTADDGRYELQEARPCAPSSYRVSYSSMGPNHVSYSINSAWFVASEDDGDQTA